MAAAHRHGGGERVTPDEQADLERTRAVLAELAERQERLADELEATGRTGFIERADWLIDHRTPDEKLAWSRRWRRLSVRDPEPHPERFIRPRSLSVPKVHRPVVALPVDRALAIALRVYDQLPPERRAGWAQARDPFAHLSEPERKQA